MDNQVATASSRVDQVSRNIAGLAAIADALAAEGTKESGRSHLGRRIGVVLGVLITGIGAIPAVFGITADASWLVGISAFMGLLVGLNSQVLNHEERHKRAEQCSRLAVDVSRFASELEFDMESAEHDEQQLRALLDRARTKEDEVDDAANKAGLKTNPHELLLPFTVHRGYLT